MKKISADIVYTISGAAIENGVVVVDKNGEILEIGKREDYDVADLEVHQGAIIPGFINTHCHLELSHMLGKVDTGTGLIPFIKGVVTKRNMAQEFILDCIERAEQEMLDNGIVAVGDISNVPDTGGQKAKGKMR